MRKNRLFWFALGIVVTLGFFIVLNKGRKARKYTGIVVNKFATTKWRLKGRRVKTIYYVEILTGKNKIIRVEIPPVLYQQIKPGDKVIKEKGRLHPQLSR